MFDGSNLPLAEKLERVYASVKSVYQLQGELGNTFMYNNNGQVDTNYKQNLERDVIQCFIRGSRPELEIRVEEKDTFREVINESVGIERRLAANSALRRRKNMDYSKSDEPTNNKNNKVARFNVAHEDKFVCLICKKPSHTTERGFHLSKAQDAVLNNKQKICCIITNKDIVISMVKEVIIMIIFQEKITIIFQITIF